MAWAKNSNLTATILFGTWVAGVATFGNGAGIDLQCMITNFDDTSTVSNLDGSVLCDDDAVNEPGRGNGTVSFDARIPVDEERIFKGKQKLPVKISVTENDAATTPEIIYGYVQEVNHSVPNDALQQESVKIQKGIRIASGG